ncbi:MAG: polysaccharide biosynthesis tyrosine autokinase [Vicinamibacterales bacterium]
MTTAYRAYVKSGTGPQQPEDRHLLDYVRVIYKRRWVAVPVFLLILVLGILNAARQTPIYRARTQMMIEKDSPSVATLDQMFQVQDGWSNDEFYQTQYRVLQSRTLAKRTLDEMRLGNGPLGNVPVPKASMDPISIVKRGFAMVSAMVTGRPVAQPVSTEPHDADESAAQSDRIDAFKAGIGIEPIRNSRLVDILYTSADPAFAAKAADAVAKAYIAQSLELRFSESKEAADWLSQQLTEQRKALQDSEAALQAFREKKGAVSVTDNASNIVVQRLTDLNSALTKAKTERINKEALYNQLKSAESSGALDSIPAVLSNDYIQKLRSEVADLQRTQAQLAERYGERHAEMIKVRTALDLADAKLKNEISKTVESIRNEYQSALAEERSLQGALDSQKSEALSLNRTGIEYGVLQREADSNKQIYENLMQRTKDAGISSERKATNIRIVDAAEVPRVPIAPNLQRSVLLSLVAGLSVSLGFVFFVEYLDSRLKTPNDIKQHLGVPFLGMIPAVPKGKDGPNPLIHVVGLSNFSEAFKTVRTNVLFSSAEDGVRSLVVTSASPGEGKSICSANIAVAMAQAGMRVLLVDADMRRPRVHEIFDLQQEPGLSNLLTGNARASETIQKSPVPGLWLMPAGHIPPNPAELLSSPRFVDFLGALEDHFDWVVLDTPPVLVVTDSVIVGNRATGVAFVVGADQTSRHAARNALDQLTGANVTVIGAILNRADVKRHSHYYASYYSKDYARYYVKQSS